MKKKISLLFKMIFLLSLGLLLSCQSSPERSQKSKGLKSCGVTRGSFLGSWFDYYERALSYADCEMWQKSASDLQRALKKRGTDKRRVYSVGMHLVADYFPHRELGVAFFYQKKYLLAEQQFTVSLAQFPTSKAEEYLKRLRKITINKNNKDQQAPVIKLISPIKGDLVKTSDVLVRGVVTDNHFIDSLLINDIPYRYVPSFVTQSGVAVRVARKVPKIEFSLKVPVKFIQGQAMIKIIAKDISGNQSVQEIPLLLDAQGPQISIHKFLKKDSDYHLVLNLSNQNSSIKYLKINNKNIAIESKTVFKTVKGQTKKQKINQVFIDQIIGGPFDKENMLIIAVDNNGNKTQAKIKLSKAKTIAQKLKNKMAQDTAKAPNIYLSKAAEQRTTLESFAYIEGEVESDSTISAVTLNGNNILNNEGTHIYFNARTELNIGENLIEIMASNQQHKKQIKRFRIIRKVAVKHRLNERLKIAQFPFPCNIVSRSACFVSSHFYQQLYDDLQKRKRFQLTNQQQLDQLIDQANSCEDELSDECVVKIASQLVAKNIWQENFANAMFVGNVIERRNSSGQVSVEIAARMVSNKTREVLTSVDIYAENMDTTKFKDFSQSMVIEISDAFPLVEAKVNSLVNNKLQVDLTEKDRIWEQMPVLIYQKKANKNCANGDFVEVGNTRSLVDYNTSQCDFSDLSAYVVITR